METSVKDKSVLVVGLGYRTGLAAANFLASGGARVLVSDIKHGDELRDVIAKLDGRVTVFAGNQSPDILNAGVDMVVLSPGVPAGIPLITEAGRRGIPVIAEIELAYRYLKGGIIAITGTDGKSTTTTLAGHILGETGVDTLVGGNIGIPLISLVGKTRENSVSVVELSSFQLETVDRFRPDVAALLNVSPDHLDRYAGMEDYFAAKMRIARNQTEDDFFVYNADDAMIASGLSGVRSQKLSFSLEKNDADACLSGSGVFLKIDGKRVPVLDPGRLQIMGVHNVQNAMASILMVTAMLKKSGISPDYSKIAEACYSFKGLEHRMERLGEFRGRLFINDSKATTVGAVEMALRSLPGMGVLILGGRTKGDDYSRLFKILREKVKHLVLIGDSAEDFSRIFNGFPQSIATSLDEAVSKAMSASAEGDTVILSPACASFDWFRNFEERGTRFKESFDKLKRGELFWT